MLMIFCCFRVVHGFPMNPLYDPVSWIMLTLRAMKEAKKLYIMYEQLFIIRMHGVWFGSSSEVAPCARRIKQNIYILRVFYNLCRCLPSME
jgi:hypothetical protein